MDNTNVIEKSLPMTSAILQDKLKPGLNFNGHDLNLVKINGSEHDNKTNVVHTDNSLSIEICTEALDNKTKLVCLPEVGLKNNLKRPHVTDCDDKAVDDAEYKNDPKKRTVKPSINLLDKHQCDTRMKKISPIDSLILSKLQDDPNTMDAETIAAIGNEANVNNFKVLRDNHDQLKKITKNSNGEKQLEYAQYLGLQPSVKFKCFRCSENSFPNYNSLKEHQKKCLLERKIVLQSPVQSSSQAQSTNFRITRKVYLCSACGTYYENWNLFLHMQTVHKRYICLFCLGMFSYAEKLSSHLESKHNVIEKKISGDDELMKVYNGSCFFMCCTCEHVFTERDSISEHCCSDYQKPCVFCGLVGNHKKNCKGALKQKTSSNTKNNTISSKLCKLQKQKLRSKLGQEVHITGDSMPPTVADSAVTFDEPNFSPAALCVVDMDGNKDNVEKEENILSEEKFSNGIKNINTCDNNVITVNKDDGLLTDDDKRNCFNHDVDISEVNEKDHEINILQSDGNVSVENSTNMLKEQYVNLQGTGNEFYTNKNSSSVDSIMEDISNVNVDNTKLVNDTEDVMKSSEEKSNGSIDDNLLNENNSNDNVQVYDSLKTTIKIPKLTVKLPRGFTDIELNTSSNSDSENENLTIKATGNNVHGSTSCGNDDKSDEKLTDKEDDLNENNDGEQIDSENNENTYITNDKLDVSTKLNANKENDKQLSTADNSDNLIIAGEDVTIFEVTLDQPLHKLPVVDLMKKCLSITVHSCLFCNHVRKIAINGKQIGIHLMAQHRFRAIVESITAEELLPETIVARITQSLSELEKVYFNLENYDSTDKTLFVPYDGFHECFRCRFITSIHKELYLHNRKCHQKAIVLCTMCKSTFYTYSELLCHLCPGTYEHTEMRELIYRCCLCDLDNLPSAFRLMVHLRKRHHTCDVCLESCTDQSRLSNHVWKHKLQHLCYRCGISYRNKPDITKHLFWKHGTESVLCKRCLQKKWPHVYHFCILPSSFVCEECGLSFTKAVALKVHKRLHNDYRPYSCAECDKKFVSKKLLVKHSKLHIAPLLTNISSINNDGVLNESKEFISNNSCSITSENCDNYSQKARKNKKSHKESLEDVVADLPALNLSESDSSDESEMENKNSTESKIYESKSIMQMEIGEEEVNPVPVMLDIWDNFKTYQASIDKTENSYGDNVDELNTVPILHVCQSDHDYCDFDDIIQKSKGPHIDFSNSVLKPSPKKIKTPKRRNRNSSSSSNSSVTSSSCSCGENCSCSSSSGSSSNSSGSSSESESSSSEGNNKRTKTKKELLTTQVSDIKDIDDEKMLESISEDNHSKSQELPIFESDLDTDESETDEDFYDEYPQRLANKLMAEKRNQLILLASLGSSNDGSSGGTADLSRTSTPSLPPDEKLVVKKVKSKKRKKDKRNRICDSAAPAMVNIPIIPPISLKINIPKNPEIMNQNSEHPVKIVVSRPVTPKIDLKPIPSAVQAIPPLVVKTQVGNLLRETDDNKRASKRRRIPNKFYGYSSDEETGMLKPQAPPQLTWHKEDLPEQPPKIVEPPPRVPPLPVHQILAQQQISVMKPLSDLSDNAKSSPSDESSSDEGTLHISQPTVSSNIPGTTISSASIRQAKEGESVYCYCRCPYDEVSEMIACDGATCSIEWFHFECVGIMVPPKGKWYCPECRQKHPQQDDFC